MEEKHIYRIYKIIADDVIPTSYVSNDLYTIRWNRNNRKHIKNIYTNNARIIW